MNIEKWCDNCRAFQYTLGFVLGDIREDTYMKIRLGSSDLKCNTCNGENITLRLVPAVVRVGTGS